MADKIKRTPLQSEIIRYIQEYIEENHLEAGDRLPSQGQLIQMMGVSRTSLREAMKTLEARQIIKVQNGKGIFVNENKDSAMLNLLDFAREKEKLLDTLEVRRVLEQEILRMVIHRAAPEEIQELGEITGYPL